MEDQSSIGLDWLGGKRKVPDGFPTPRKIMMVVFWVIVVLLAWWILRVEKQHLGCYTERQNQCVSPFYRIAPVEGDDNVTLLQRVENGIRLPEEGNVWRKTLIISMVISIILVLLVCWRFPSPFEFIICLAVVYVILYSLNNWYQMHVWYRVAEEQLRTVNQLRVNLGYLTPSTKNGVYGPNETTGFEF